MAEPNATEPTRGIQRTLAEWASALEKADLASVVSLVTSDAVFWSHGARPLVGREALAAAFRPFLEKYTLSQRFEVHEQCLGADWCLLCGLETNVLKPRDGGEGTEVRQRAFSLLRLEPDGRWRFARGMTNQGPDEGRDGREA